MKPTNKPTKAPSRPSAATPKADKTKDTIKPAADAQKAGEGAPEWLKKGLEAHRHRVAEAKGNARRLPRIKDYLRSIEASGLPGDVRAEWEYVASLPPGLERDVAWVRLLLRHVGLEEAYEAALVVWEEYVNDVPPLPKEAEGERALREWCVGVLEGIEDRPERKPDFPKAAQEFTFDGAMAYFNGKALMLGTGIPLEAFKKLVEKEGRPVPFKELYPRNERERKADEVLRSAINSIRRALEAVGAPYEVRNVRAYGYRLKCASSLKRNLKKST